MPESTELIDTKERSHMTSPTATIKQELPDSSYDNNDVSESPISYVRHSTPKIPSIVDKNTTTAAESEERDNHLSPAKRQRLSINNKFQKHLLNGHKHCNMLFLSPAYEHYEGSHSNSMLRSLNERRQGEQFVDLVLVVDGKEIPCHKVVLCSVSEYFAEMLVPNSATRYQQRVHVNETTAEIMSQLIEYTYTSRIKITDKNIDQLLSAAKVFKFLSVQEACMMVLKQRLSADNCISIKRFAVKQDCEGLARSASLFAYENFLDVSKTKDFEDLNLKELLNLVSCKTLNVKKEEVIYEAVMKWVKKDAKSRKQFLPNILEHVRLPLVKPQFLLDVVQSESLIKNNKDCERFLDEARRFQLLADQRPLMQSCRTQPRSAYSLKKSEILVTIGGLNKEKVPVQDCTYFDFPDQTAKQLAPMTVNQTAYSVASVHNNIFATGGAHHSPCKEVWMYIPSLNKWQQGIISVSTVYMQASAFGKFVFDDMPNVSVPTTSFKSFWNVAPMNEPRYLHASVGLDGYLYVIGGHNGVDRLKTIERYNPDTNTWQQCESMIRELSSPTVVACEGLLYVIGGAKGNDPSDITSDVQCYNPNTEKWKLVAPLPQPERGAVAADLNGTVYVMGQQKSVFCYNRKTNTWVKQNNTNGGHLYGAAAVHRGQLYVAGGLHGNSYINGTVEIYDSLNDAWHVTSTLHVPVYAQGFVSIFKDDATSSNL